MNLFDIFSNPAYQGLLSEGDNEQLRRQALLNSGLATLAASQGGQPGIGRAALFPALLQGLQAGQQAYTSGAEGLLKSQELQQKRMQEQRRKQLLGGLASGSATQDALAGGGGPTVANAEKMQQAQGASKERYLRAFNEAISMGDIDLAKQLKDAMEVQFPKQESIFDKVDVSKFDPDSVRKFVQTQNYGDLVAKSDEPEAIKTLRILQQNPDLAALSASQKRAGATIVSPSFKIGNTFGEDVAKAVAGNVMGQVDAATAAADTVSTIQNMRQALPKAITGTGANARIALARLGQTIGVGGKDEAEALAATSQVIQGLAKTQLSSAQANKGQGTFTDFERQLLARASSGDINMTPRELDALFNAVEKGARKQYEIGIKQASKMQQTPMFQQIAPFIAVPQLPSVQENSDPLGLRGK